MEFTAVKITYLFFVFYENTANAQQDLSEDSIVRDQI